jgi:hypothetical protein
VHDLYLCWMRILRLGTCLLLAVLAAVVMAACGGSSKSSSSTGTSTVAKAASSTTASTSAAGRAKPARSHSNSNGASAAFKRALESYTACLASNGVKLPAHTGPEQSLNGVNTSTASYRRARTACIPALTAELKTAAKSSPAPAAPAPHAALTVKVPASVTATLTRFTTCMRAHGVGTFPQPKGATFDMTGTHIDTHSATYKSAEAHCNSILQALDQTG